MCMIQNYSKKALLSTCGLLILLSANPVGAQESAWPRTFAGQPDFEFTRENIADEFRRKKGREAYKYIATLGTILQEREIDPFEPTPVTADIGRSKYSQESFEAWVASDNQPFRSVYPDIAIGTGVNVKLTNGQTVQAQLVDDNHVLPLDSDRKVRIEVTQGGDIVEYIERQNIAAEFDQLFSTNSKSISSTDDELDGLPQFDFTNIELPEIELSDAEKDQFEDFKEFLQTVLAQSLVNDNSNIKNRDFTPEVRNIFIQSIVTSPMKYAIINHRRYNVGDRFIMRVEKKEEDSLYLSSLIDVYLPKKDTLEEKLYEQYLKVKEEAIKQFKEKQNKTDEDGNLLKKTEDVSVIIKEIERKKVVISIFDRDYPLHIRISL